MENVATVLPFQHPKDLDGPLTSVLRERARRLLAQAGKAEAEAFLDEMRQARSPGGRA